MLLKIPARNSVACACVSVSSDWVVGVKVVSSFSASSSHNRVHVPLLVGNVKQNLAPQGGLSPAHKRPPCDSTMERLIRRPMPVP
jgi:hypothetical protein